METTLCSYSQHQATDLVKSTQYSMARAVLDSLIEDCKQAIEACEAEETSIQYGQGKVSAYNAVLSNLQLWRDVLLK